MKSLLLFFFTCFTLSSFAQASKKDELAIRKLLHEQTIAWNKGDIEGFMKGYWMNDSLMFIGQSGVTYGWKNTLNNYKKNYPDAATMGQLSFDILVVKQLSPQYAQVVGKWFLKRTVGDVSGHYMLLLRKINGKWLIIADHSS